nr:PREDICTED: membrane-associated guanylate kinase, WW and PDZ domain-containing protein 1-like [Lepisosteus oculatus]
MDGERGGQEERGTETGTGCSRRSLLTMSKAAVKKLHWRSKVQESFVPLGGASGELGVSIGGGADYGEFPFVTSVQGGGTNVGDVILEIGGTPVLGMTLGDVRGVLNSCPHPIRIKTVSPGSTLCKDLRLYLSKCFTPGSMDSQLQQVIRENLYLRAVPCTTRLPRDGEISGVDYNFVSVEEFFSLEESGALLESGKFKGNYYGTPRPVHIGPESPPITYQEHRNLLRNFRTRSKSLSNLEKTGEEGENSEEDSGLSGGSLGVSSGAPPGLSPSQSRDSSGGDGSTMENGGAGLPENWEMAFSDSGEPYYIDHTSKTTSWLDPRTQNRESVPKPESKRGRCRLCDSLTSDPRACTAHCLHNRCRARAKRLPALLTDSSPLHSGVLVLKMAADVMNVRILSSGTARVPASPTDILVFINDACVLGLSHKEAVEMLKSVPVGQSVDVVLRRGYPMLYNPDGCPKLRGGGGGELVPVAVGRSEQGMGFSVTAGGQGGRLAVVKRVWDRRQCPSLQPGDAILKINGADVQSLSFAQVQRVLQEHTHQGEVVLLVYRGGSLRSPLSPGIPKRTPHLLQPLAPQNGAPPGGGAALLPSPEGSAPQPGTTGGAPDLAPAATPDLIPSPTSLVQSTSFLDSVPVTLTLEPRDWLSPEEGGRGAAGGQGDWHGALVSRTVEVELRRRAGEGFGFVIASQDAESGRAASLLPHKFIQIRRGSPADRSERIHPGDRLEGINGQSVLSLPHRELAEIFRRAGNTIRLRIVPRSSTNSNLSEPTEVDTESRVRKGHRSRHKDARYYSVDLERGPTGFGFSLRGGSEYNMGLYVLGLMEGGPASRSHKIQARHPTISPAPLPPVPFSPVAGCQALSVPESPALLGPRGVSHPCAPAARRQTHPQGSSEPRRPEFRGQSPSPAVLHKEQGLAAVRDADRPRSSRRSKVKEEQGEQEEDGEKTSGGHGRRGNRGGGRRREEGSLCPETDSLDGALQGKGGRRGQRSPSRDSARIPARDEEGAEPERGRARESRGERAGGRSWSEGREGRRGQRGEEEQGRKREGEERGKRRGHSLPIPAEGLPSAQAPPEPEQRGSPPSPAPAQTGPQAPEREPFSFLLPRAPEAPEPDGARAWGEEGARPSEGGFKPRGTLLPGPWLRPSKEKLLLALDSSQGPGGGGVA